MQSSDPAGSPAPLVRHPEFWFDDGTIVLQVERTLYRVYRGLLSARSTVFHDTFSIPQPESPDNSEQSEIEGCPVVKLHDREKDFTRFLKALLHHGSYKTTAVANFAELSSVLRLSDKYDVPVLRESLTSMLQDIYPSSLDKWLKRNDTIPPGYQVRDADNVLALNLARKLNIRSILPGVMYLTSQRHGLGVLYATRSGKIEHPDDRRHYVLAIPELIIARRRVWTQYLVHDEDGIEACETEEGECDAERIRWLSLDLPREDDIDPLHDEIPWKDFAVCPPCLELAQTEYTKARQQLWDDLPSIFGLGTWDELLA
ncbi:BTB domain-containing protein [Favolaschia claudopus]|uniref:BTB domain-containing protein n=1 Tax=Favolaschia claudopus TaxID=2862362 RepID=A0AAW0CIE8_9AGAR